MISNDIITASKAFAALAIDTLNTSVSAFNFTEAAIAKWTENNFSRIYESDSWSWTPGQKYFYTRNNSCIIAFTVGQQYNSKTSSIKIIGAHTDSPSLRIAPKSYNPSGEVERYNIECYGGGLWYTWLDRDLSVAGKVVYRNKDNKLVTKIIKCNKPIFFIPSLPPHLKNADEARSWTLNKETHLKPWIATVIMSNSVKPQSEITESNFKDKKLGETWSNVILKELNEKDWTHESIIDYDLCLYDTQPSQITGVNDEFISSGRLDNLGSSIPALHSIINSSTNELLAKQSSINVIALFDNEEIGSQTYQGADSNFFYNNLQRIFSTISPDTIKNLNDEFSAMINRSFVISADWAHAYNPNYGEKYQSGHVLHMQKGVVWKINANGRYSTDSESNALMKEVAKKVGVPMQEFIVRQDSPCGSTIGPIISSKLGMRSVDIGIPQLAMHSIREMLGVVDLYYYKLLFEEFFRSYEEVKGDLFKL